jgi:hypothetical protein
MVFVFIGIAAVGAVLAPFVVAEIRRRIRWYQALRKS